MMQIVLSPFAGVHLAGTVLMMPVVPCGPGHEVQLFPIDSFISAPGDSTPQHSQQSDCFLYIPLSCLASQCSAIIALTTEHAETQGTAGCHTLPVCPLLAGADMAQGNSKTKADKALQLF